MIPEEIGPHATTDFHLNLLSPAAQVEAKAFGDGLVWLKVEARPHFAGLVGAQASISMPVETALQIYARLGDAIDQAMQRKGTATIAARRA